MDHEYGGNPKQKIKRFILLLKQTSSGDGCGRAIVKVAHRVICDGYKEGDREVVVHTDGDVTVGR